jgi:hypothetical protein
MPNYQAESSDEEPLKAACDDLFACSTIYRDLYYGKG